MKLGQLHNLRSTSAFVLCNGRGNLGMVQRLDRWESTTMAQDYVEESISSKMNIAKKVLGKNPETESNVNVNTENKEKRK